MRTPLECAALFRSLANDGQFTSPVNAYIFDPAALNCSFGMAGYYMGNSNAGAPPEDKSEAVAYREAPCVTTC